MKIICCSILLFLLVSGCQADTIIFGAYNQGQWQAVMGGQSITATCIDYAHYAPTGGQSYAYSVSSLDNLNATRNPASAAKYQQIAWLYEQMLKPEFSMQWRDLQYAMWGVFSGADPSNVNVQRWLSLSITGMVDTSQYVVLTPFGSTQEMISRRLNIDAPEPGTLLLLGGGLAALGLRRRRKNDV